MRIALLGTGGTIASCSGASGRTASLEVERLYDACGFASDEVEVRCRNIAVRPSAALTFDDLGSLAETTRAEVGGAESRAGAEGIVITHGTDALEETAFLLNLVHAGSQPVVLTGAQRPFDDPSPDGPRNLAHALEWAACSAARNTGVTVTFDGSILPAVGLRKVETSASSAFAAPGRGVLGRVSESGPTMFARPVRSPALIDAAEVAALPRVAVLPLYLECGTAALEAAVSDGARGIVLAAFGAGNATERIVHTVRELIAGGIPVAVSSRVGSGPVAGLYATGGGADLWRAGAVFGADLSPWQLRLLLAAAILRGGEPPEVNEVVRGWLARGGP